MASYGSEFLTEVLQLIETQGRVFLDLRCLTVQHHGLAVVLKGPAQSHLPLLLFILFYIHQALRVPELPHLPPISKSRREFQTTQSSAPASGNPAFWKAHFPWQLNTKDKVFTCITYNRTEIGKMLSFTLYIWIGSINWHNRIRKPRGSRGEGGRKQGAAGGTFQCGHCSLSTLFLKELLG